jgi:Ca2+-binding EF-hand superfamily protein
MMKNLKITLGAVTLAAMLAASVSTVAFAQSGPRGGDRMMFDFTAMDADGDGSVTQDEIAAQRLAQITAMDKDGDGNLSEAELLAGQEMRNAERQAQRAKRMVARMDADKDGVVSLAEMAPNDQRGVEMFKRIDTNGDGAISKAEADSAVDRMATRGGKEGRGDHKGGHHKHRNN